MPFGSDNLALSPHNVFLAQVTAVAAGSGTQAGLNIYTFVEQAFDSSSGIAQNAYPARQTEPTSGTPVSSYALEVSNASLTPPFYCWMRYKGQVGGIAVYEFQAPSTSALAYVALLNTTSQSVNLSGGGSVTAFQAKTWTLNAGIWTSGSSCWYSGPNGEEPPHGVRLLAKQIATDTVNTPVYSEDVLPSMCQIVNTNTTVITTNVGPSLTVYPALTYNPVTGGTGAACWLFDLSTTPNTSQNYQCELLCQDNAGKNVYVVADILDASNTVRGVVSLSAQKLGQGTKYVDSLGVNVAVAPLNYTVTMIGNLKVGDGVAGNPAIGAGSAYIVNTVYSSAFVVSNPQSIVAQYTTPGLTLTDNTNYKINMTEGVPTYIPPAAPSRAGYFSFFDINAISETSVTLVGNGIYLETGVPGNSGGGTAPVIHIGTNTGQTLTISYTKPGGATGTLTFVSGILTATT